MAYRARPKKARTYREVHFWVCVEVGMTCHLGAHDVGRGVWVRMRRGDWRRFAACETCLHRQYGTIRPGSTFTFHEEPVTDVRARQSGGDE